ncbi:MAG: polysaccharide biosynthesis protein, partial [Lachnospiraceae bacterium]|nr:polysaccharide biosynthesis protein [Lachnospiraceae bacterium]
RLFIESAKILKEEQPDCIISTGALATFPICVIGKAMKKKVIFIESFARVDGSSLTGKLMKKVADLYIVQWEELLQFVPDAVYGGGIF